MRTLFLNPPSYQGFDGGAGSRYQARREIRSFWYPTWLAQAAAMVPDSLLVDAPAGDLSVRQVLNLSQNFELIVIYTSTPSFRNDARLASQLKKRNPYCAVCFVGPHVSVLPGESLAGVPAVDFVVRREFDRSVQQIAQGISPSQVPGVSWRDGDTIRHNPDAELLTDLDSLPFVIDVYKRDLTIENYFIGYLMHPYLSIYTGRGCPARCTFCLWPQTMTGHTYRARSPESVQLEMQLAKDYFPQVKEFFIDDDTFTADPVRAVAIARRLGELSVTWSTSARATADRDTLSALKQNGLRLLMVGFESGSDDILRRARKGITTDIARRFMHNCRDLGIQVHGTFMLGLPGETRETIEQTIRFACELDPRTVQVSIAAPYPGTELYREAVENGWLTPGDLVSQDGTQDCPLRYDGITGEEIAAQVERFYKRFYFRPKVIYRMGKEMAHDPETRKRRLREGREFFSFTKSHRKQAGNGEGLLNVLRTGGPGFCQFAITDACNARCAFCDFSTDVPAEKPRVFVDVDDARAALGILASNGTGYIAFVGGEPTVHPHLTEMIAHSARLGMHSIICTNGSRLDRHSIGQYVNAGLDSAIISIDAADRDVHEQNRGLPGLCEKIAEANRLLRDAHISTTASVTISRLIPDMSALPEMLTSLGFDRVTFSYPLTYLPSSFRGASTSPLVDYSREELCALFDEVIKLKRRFPVANPTASLREMKRFVHGEAQRFPCLAGYKYFHLDWNLDLYRCHAWHEPMCSIFEFDGSQTIRDGCTKCMIDCYRDASVLHSLGISLHDTATHLSERRLGPAIAGILNRRCAEAAAAVSEELRFIRGLRRRSRKRTNDQVSKTVK